MNFIPIANPIISSKEAKAVYDVVKKGWISMGKNVQKMEKKLKNILMLKTQFSSTMEPLLFTLHC